MTFFSKSLSPWVISASLFISPIAGAESGCVSRECGEITVQVELLRAQLGNAHATLKKLETELIVAKQDISLLQNSTLYKPHALGDIQRTANGHGR